MDHKQTIAMLTWINQVDPRVMLNEASVDVWAYAMRGVPVDVAKQSVLEHYKANEGIAASPGAINKRAQYIKASRDAKQQAITAGPVTPPKSFKDYERRVLSPEFRALFEEGKRQGDAERKAATEARNVAAD